jgi:hypothetical protein
MTALAKMRMTKVVKATGMALLSTAEQVYQGGLACFDTSTGLVKKGAASTTLIPIGRYREDQLVASGGTANVEFFRELNAMWFANSASGDLIAQTEVGSNVYVVDDQTVAKTSNSNARSIAGRVWKVDATKGVLVELSNPT